VLLSDHGEGLGDHGELEHGIFVYSETVRVPLIVKLPGKRGAGRRVAAPVQHVDLLPTVLALVGAPRAGPARPRHAVFGSARIAEQGLRRALYALPSAGAGWPATRGIGSSDAERRAYDQRRIRRAANRRRAPSDAWRAPGAGSPAGGLDHRRARHVTADERERLRALGYVGMQATVDSRPGLDTLPDPKDKVQVLERYRQALDAVRRGEFDPAITILQAIVDENPAMADVWNEMAGLLVRQGG
jgi:hypothetical protein